MNQKNRSNKGKVFVLITFAMANKYIHSTKNQNSFELKNKIVSNGHLDQVITECIAYLKKKHDLSSSTRIPDQTQIEENVCKQLISTYMISSPSLEQKCTDKDIQRCTSIFAKLSAGSHLEK